LSRGNFTPQAEFVNFLYQISSHRQ
jgi:hypothetical protein